MRSSLPTIAETPRFQEDLENVKTSLISSIKNSSQVQKGAPDLTNKINSFIELASTKQSSWSIDLKDRLQSIASDYGTEIKRYQGTPFDAVNEGDDSFDASNHVRIGTVLTTVPPESISVEELKSSESYYGIRTNNNYEVKTGRGSIRIQLSLTFPNTNSINQELRHIIGQFRTSPLTILESQYIYDVVHGSLITETPDEQLSSLKSDLSSLVAEESRKRTELKDKLSSLGISTTVMEEQDATKLKPAVEEKFRELSSSQKSKTRVNLFSRSERIFNSADRLLDRLITIQLSKKEISRKLVSKSLQQARISFSLPILPVVFERLNISTVPGFPETLEASISFLLFNHIPYADQFLFRDITGGWTPSISDCLYYKAYYTSRMSSDLEIKPFSNSEPTIIRFPEEDSTEFSATNIINDKNNRNAPFEELVLSDNPLDGSIYISASSISISHPLPRIPVLSGQYPVFQFMGSIPANVVLRLMVKHEEVGKIHRIKRNIDQILLHSGGRRRRRAFVEILNLPVVNITGHSTFQISGINTQTIDPTWSSVDLNLVSYKVPLLEKPAFAQDKNSRTTIGRIYRAWLEIWNLATNFERNTLSDLHDNAVYNEAYSDLIKNKDSPEFQAWEFLIHAEDRFVSLSLVRAAMALTNTVYQDKYIGSGSDEYRPFNKTKLSVHVRASDLDKIKIEQKHNKKESERLLTEIDRIPKITPTSPNVVYTLREVLLGGIASDEVFDYLFPYNDSALSKRQTKLEYMFGSAEPLTKELESLANLVLGTTKYKSLYKHLQDLHKKQIAEENRDFLDQLNPYPDLNLPTYEDLLKDIEHIVEETFNTSKSGVAGEDNHTTTKDWLNTLPDGFKENLLNGLDLNYQLGMVNLPESDQGKLAAKSTDRVDPDFYMFRNKTTNLIDEVLERIVRPEAARLTNVSDSDRVKKNIESAMLNGGRKIEARQSPEGAAGFFDAPFLNTIGSFFNPATSTVQSSSPIEERYASASSLAAGLSVYNPNAKENMMDLFEKSAASIKDDKNRLSKFFPTYRLYFIHEERGILYKYADWYGYNAITSLHVTRHKTQPDVAQFSISNPTGYLDDLRFAERAPEERLHDAALRKENDSSRSTLSLSNRPKNVSNPANEKVVDKLILAEGTRIVIKMGYSSSESLLETVFTGRIAELQQGDIIQVVAQGYAGELGFPIQVPLDIKIDTSWQSLFERLGIFTSRPHKLLGLVSGILSHLPTENLGDWGIGDIFVKNVDALDSNAIGSNILANSSRIFKALFADPRLENIGGLIEGLYIRDIEVGAKKGETNILSDLSSWTLEADQTGIQAFRDIVTMFPGHIYTVLPYDDRATVYIGRPEGRYYYTNDGGDERRIKDRLFRDAALPTLTKVPFGDSVNMPKAVEEVRQLLNEFFSIQSAEGFEFSRYVKNHAASQAGEILSAEDSAEYEKLRAKDLFNGAGEDIVSNYTQYLSNSREGAEVFIRAALIFLSKGEITNNLFLSTSVDNKIIPANILMTAPFESVEALWLPISTKSNLDQLSTEFKLVGHKAVLRRYLISFLEFLKSRSKSAPDAKLFRDIHALSEQRRKALRDGTKPVRNYHFVDSVHHIIANNIIATRGVMKNIIRIFGSDRESSKTVAVDDDLNLGDYLVGHAYSPNANTPVLQYLSGYGHLAEAMRPMYRGELIIRGDETIKPYDIVFIYDLCNKMYGPIEVERVTHSYTYETGFTTTITPHLYCTATNDADWIHTTLHSMLSGLVGVGLVLGATVAVPALFGLAVTSTIAGAAVAVGTGSVSWWGFDKLYQNISGASVWETLMGRGNFGREENPVTIMPLVLNGEPFVAAMGGYKAGNYYIGKLGDKNWQWFKKGIERTINDVSKGYDSLDAFRKRTGGY